MSDDATAGRPRQVTVAGWVAVVASALLVFSIVDRMGALNSVDMREEISRMLDTGSGTGLGLTLAEARSVIRWALFVAGAAAAATAVLGFFVLRRDRTARVALTVATVPLVLCAPFAGGFLAAVVAASTAMLWTRPARDWFAGRPVRPSSVFLDASRTPRDAERRGGERRPEPPAFVAPPVSRPSHDDAPHPGGEPGTAPGGQPGNDRGPHPTHGYGDAPGGHAAPPPYSPGPAPFGTTHAGPPSAGRLAARPRAVRTACVVAAVFTGIAFVAGLVLAGVLALSPDSLVDQITGMQEWQQAGLDKDLLVPALWSWAVVLVLWSAGALVLVWFTWRRSNGARIALLVSAVLAGVVGVLGFPISLPHLIACASVVGLLVSAPAKAWFAQPTQQGGRPGPW